MSDEKVNRVGNNPLQAPQPQTKTVTKTTKTVSKDEVDALIAKAKAENKQVIEKDGKILIQAQAKHLKQLAPKQNAETGKTETATSMRQASQTAEIKGSSRVESKQDASLRQTSKVTTAKLGDKPELPTSSITKMDAAVVKSLLSKMGSSEATFRLATEDSGALGQHLGAAANNVLGPSGGNMLLMSGSPESQNFMLLMLLLELGYQNRDINREMAKAGQLLQSADTDMKKTAGLVEQYTKRAAATFQYMNKMNDAKVQEQQAMRDAAKAINTFAMCDLPAWKAQMDHASETRAVGTLRDGIESDERRIFGPQPPDATRLSAAQAAYRNALNATNPVTSPEQLRTLREAVQREGGDQAVVNTEASVSQEALTGSGVADDARNRAARFSNEAAALPERRRAAEERQTRADETFRTAMTGIESRRARMDHPNWPPGAAEAFGAARGDHMLAVQRQVELERRRSRERGDLEGIPEDQRTPAQRARLAELDAEKNEASNAVSIAETRYKRIERIANQEEGQGDRLPVAERTNWAEVARGMEEDRATGGMTLADATAERARLGAIPDANLTPAQRTRMAQLDGHIAAHEERARLGAIPEAQLTPAQRDRMARLDARLNGSTTSTLLDASERRLDAYRELPSGIDRRAYVAARQRYDAATTRANAAQATVRSTSARIGVIDRRNGEIDAELGGINSRLANMPPTGDARMETERRRLIARRDALNTEKAGLTEERDQLVVTRNAANAAAQQATAERAAAEAQLAGIRGVGGRPITPEESVRLSDRSATAAARGADLTRASAARANAQERVDDFNELGDIDAKLGRMRPPATVPTDADGIRQRCTDCGLPEQPWSEAQRTEMRARYGLPDNATDAQILERATTAETARLTSRRGALLSDLGLPANASADAIATGKTAAETDLTAKNTEYASAWRAYNSAMAGLRTETYGIEMRTRGWDGPPTLPAGTPTGTPNPSLPATRPPATPLPDGVPTLPTTPTTPASAVYGAVAGWREQALADYATTLSPSPTGVAPRLPPPFQEPRATRASYAADFGPDRIPRVGTPPRPATEAELADPSTITNATEREAVERFRSARALARADLIDQEATPFLQWGAQVYENHFRPADATAYAAAQAESRAADAELTRLGITERPPPFPPPAVTPANPARDTERRNAAAAYYAARRNEEGARLTAIGNSYVPPRDVSAAQAELTNIWGPPLPTPRPSPLPNPTGLAVEYAGATDETRPAIEARMTTARTHLGEVTPPARDNLIAPTTMKMTGPNGAESDVTVGGSTSLSAFALADTRTAGGPDQYWQPADITTYNAAVAERTAATTALGALTPAVETSPPPPLTSSPVNAARDAAVARYYRAERAVGMASANGIANSHAPPKDPAAARAAVERLWGTEAAPGGLYGRYAAADEAHRPAIQREITEANRPIDALTPRGVAAPSGRTADDLRSAHLQEQIVRQNAGDIFWSNLANMMSKMQAIPNATEYLLQQWTRIAQEQINAMSGMGEEVRQRLLRMKSQTSGDWQRTLMAMEKALKATLR